MIVKVSLSLATVMLIGNFLIASADEKMKYDDKYDNIDIDLILANDKLRIQYIDCYFDVTLCFTADAKYFHDIFSEAVVTKCQKCTPRQVEILNKITDWYMKNDPDTWKRIVEKALEDLKHVDE